MNRSLLAKFSAHRRTQSESPERGATLLEFTLGILVFLILSIFVVEFARLLTVQAILTRAAQRGLDLAITIDGIDSISYGLATGDSEYDEYLAARNRVINSALDFAEGLLVSRSVHDDNAPYPGGAGAGGMQVLSPYLLPNPASGLIGTETSSVLFLRPGDQAKLLDAYSGANKGAFDHVSLCSTSGCVSTCKDISGLPCTKFVAPASQAAYDRVLLSHPMVVELSAEVRPIVPLIPMMRVKGVAVGYREVYPTGGLPGGGNFTTTTSTSTTTTTTTSTTTTISTSTMTTTSITATTGATATITVTTIGTATTLGTVSTTLPPPPPTTTVTTVTTTTICPACSAGERDLCALAGQFCGQCGSGEPRCIVVAGP